MISLVKAFAEMPAWTPCSEKLPPAETVVLLLVRKYRPGGEEDDYDTRIHEGHLMWEEPGWEDTYQRFQFFATVDETIELEWDDVTHWMPRPDDPT